MDNINQIPSQALAEKKSVSYRKAKLWLILLRTFFVILSISVVVLYTRLNREQTKRRMIENTLQEVSTAKDFLDKELEETTNLMKQTSDQLDLVKKELDLVKKELGIQIQEKEKIIAEKIKSDKKIEEITSYLREISDQLKMTTGQVNEIKQGLEAELKEKTQLREDMSLVRDAKEALEKKITDSIAKKEIELSKIVISPRPNNKTKKGEIVSINKDLNFIIINLGKKAGVKKGSIFKILRDSQIIGKIKIQKVYDNTSVGEILSKEQKGNVQEGDTVTY